MIDDNSLLRAYVVDGSEKAFTELVQRHLPLVYSAAHRRLNGDAHAAADVAQLVFLAMARESRALLRHTSLTAWLYTATRNAAISRHRSELRRQNRENAVIAIAEPEPRPDWEQLRQRLDQAMDELGEQDREAILLHFFQGRRYAEIGEALGLSSEAVRKRVDRGLEELRGTLEAAGMTSATATLGALLSTNGASAAPSSLAGEIITVAGALHPGLGAGAVATAAVTGTSPIKLATLVASAALALAIGGAVVLYVVRSGPLAPERAGSERASPASKASEAAKPRDPVTPAKLSGFVQGAQERMGDTLTVHEAQVLDRLYGELLNARRKEELKLAKSETVNDRSVLITIPEYYRQGLELYTAFGDHLIAELGKARGREILRALDTTIRANNAQFGIAEQSILVEDRGATLHIVHGTGSFIKVNNQIFPTHGTSISDVRKTDLLEFDYLKSLLTVHPAASGAPN